MKLSIIMRTWNRLEYTIESIKSIRNNSGLDPFDYEIICVDQGSTDGTVEWLRAAQEDNYYPVWPVFLEKNRGDGLGMQAGILRAEGEFIAQMDSDIELITEDYYKKLIGLYQFLDERGYDPCAIGGTHVQGANLDSSPFKFAKKRYDSNIYSTIPYIDPITQTTHPIQIIYSAWVTASFIFKRQFAEQRKFDKRMCNSWCGYWWDEGFMNAIYPDLKFWHIDSGETGAHVQKQYDKFPNYSYVLKNYRKFIKEK